MLEGLQQVPWAELSHAYGEASDVPELLLALTSDQEEVRNHALATFFCTICHQGTVYQASAYTAPFLIELLIAEAVEGKERILDLLADLARGDERYRQFSSSSGEEEIQKTRGDERFWARKTHQAVAEGRDVYEDLLQSPQSEVRMGAAYVLALLPEYALRTVPLLSTCFAQEDREGAKANLVFCLGLLDREGERGSHFLRKLAREAESLLIRFVAALALVRCGREDVPHQVIDLLLQVGMHERSIDPIFLSFPWRTWKAEIEAMHAVQCLHPHQAHYAISGIIAALHAYLARLGQEMDLDLWHYRNSKELLSVIAQWAKEHEEYEGDDPGKQHLFQRRIRFSREIFGVLDEAARTAASLAFQEEKVKEEASFQQLAFEQQQVLLFLTECGLVWHFSGGWRDQTTGRWVDVFRCAVILGQFGLPRTQEELSAFVQRGERSKRSLRSITG